MSDLIADDVAQEQQAFADAFSQASSGEPAPVVDPAPAEPTEPVIEQAAPEETVTLTQSEVKKLLSRLDELDRMKETQQKFSGHLGSFKQVLDSIKTSQAGGAPVQLTEEDFAEIAQDYPDLAKAQLVALNRVASKLSTGSGAPAFDATALEKTLDQRLVDHVSKAEKKQAIDLLRIRHKDFQTVVSTDDFGLWKQQLPEAERALLDDSWDPIELADRLDQFKEWRAKKADGGQKKTNRLEQAITPTNGVAAGGSESEYDAFIKAFNQARVGVS